MGQVIGGGGGGVLQSASVRLTNAQVKALPTTPFVLVAATETLNYTGTPTKLPIPVLVSMSVSRAAAAYTNIDPGIKAQIVWGSDFSASVVGLERPIGTEVGASTLFAGGTDPVASALAVWGTPNLVPPLALSGQLFDNALAVTVLNGAVGDLTGGDAANSARITVVYYLMTL